MRKIRLISCLPVFLGGLTLVGCSSGDGGIKLEEVEPEPEAKDAGSMDAGGGAEAGASVADAGEPAEAGDNGQQASMGEWQPDSAVDTDSEQDAGAVSDLGDAAGVELDATTEVENPSTVDAATSEEEQEPQQAEPEQGIVMSFDWPVQDQCIYQSPAVSPETLPDAGADAGPPAGPHITVESSSIWGDYLADHDGLSLYIYTADLPGDCENPPVSTCVEDCLQSWPLFEAGDRELVEALSDSDFGSFVRSDGARQTTYLGWPLYYYRKDLEAGDANGQAKGRVWYLAEQELPNLLIMRASEERDGVRYLATGNGLTLYAYDMDVLGTETQMPQSACIGSCTTQFVPFSVRSLHAVTRLEPEDLSIFVRDDGLGQQVSFQGQPLYLSTADLKSGDMNGLEVEGFGLVSP